MVFDAVVFEFEADAARQLIVVEFFACVRLGRVTLGEAAAEAHVEGRWVLVLALRLERFSLHLS